jgi:hypothetical protein
MPNAISNSEVRLGDASSRRGTPLLLQHSRTTIIDSYISPSSDALILRRIDVQAEDAARIQEIRIPKNMALRLREQLNDLCSAEPEYKVTSTMQMVPPMEELSTEPDLMARILREQEEESRLARQRAEAEAAAEIPAKTAHASGTPAADPNRPPLKIFKGLMPESSRRTHEG